MDMLEGIRKPVSGQISGPHDMDPPVWRLGQSKLARPAIPGTRGDPNCLPPALPLIVGKREEDAVLVGGPRLRIPCQESRNEPSAPAPDHLWPDPSPLPDDTPLVEPLALPHRMHQLGKGVRRRLGTERDVQAPLPVPHRVRWRNLRGAELNRDRIRRAPRTLVLPCVEKDRLSPGLAIELLPQDVPDALLRIPAKRSIHSASSDPPVPGEAGHSFRFMWATGRSEATLVEFSYASGS
jgi:hypothetical protein